MIKPFSTGTECLIWRGNNCDECQNNYDWEGSPDEGRNNKCKAEEALAMALIGDGLITKEVADFIGLQKSGHTWLCPNKSPMANKTI